MKKLFRKAILAIAILGMGTGVTSCDEDTINNLLTILAPVIKQMIWPNSQPNQSYVGTLSGMCLSRPEITEANNNWSETSTVTITDMTCQYVQNPVTDEQGNQSTEIYFSLPTLTINGVEYTNFEIYAGTFNSTDGVTGTFNTDGGFYNVAADEITDNTNFYACINNGKVTANGITFEFQIVAGKNACNGSYTGTLVQNNTNDTTNSTQK